MSIKSIFQEGLKERKRKKSLGKVNGELRDKEKVHSAQLTALGQKAWEAKIDISSFTDLKAGLLDVQKILDELHTQAEQLQKQKQDDEAQKKRDSDLLGAAIREAEEKKRATDGRLDEQKAILQNGQKETQQATGRLAAIAKEQAQLLNRNANPAMTETEKSEIAKGMDLLTKEDAELKAANLAREEAGKPVSAQIASLQEESARMQKRLDELRGELKRMLGERVKKISALQTELSRNSDKVKEAAGRQKLNFKALGEKLVTAQGVPPDIAKEMAAVLNARTEMQGIQSFIGGLERQRDEGQVVAYKKMMAILITGILLIAAIIVALIILL